jgi:hypothetical protein
MKTPVTPQRETGQRTCVPFFPVAQRGRYCSNSLSALQGATTYEEVRIYKVARFALPKTHQSFHFHRGEHYEE